jgi:hypothetical protein
MTDEQDSASTCATCFPIRTDPERSTHKIDFLKLQDASTYGCKACRTLWQGVVYFIDDIAKIQQIYINKDFNNPRREIQVLGSSVLSEKHGTTDTVLANLDAYESGGLLPLSLAKETKIIDKLLKSLSFCMAVCGTRKGSSSRHFFQRKLRLDQVVVK